MSKETNSIYVQYGCGFSAPVTWRNFDASPTLRFERIPLLGKLSFKNSARFPSNVEFGDIIRGLPVESNHCKAVYCSHVLEHLALEDVTIAFKNTYKILSENGIFRFVIPDLSFLINEYLANRDEESAILFMQRAGLGLEKRLKGLKDFLLNWIGNSRHLWMWDFLSIKAYLENVGFSGVRKAEFGDSEEMIFKDVEVQERWDNCLGVECWKIKK